MVKVKTKKKRSLYKMKEQKFVAIQGGIFKEQRVF